MKVEYSKITGNEFRKNRKFSLTRNYHRNGRKHIDKDLFRGFKRNFKLRKRLGMRSRRDALIISK